MSQPSYPFLFRPVYKPYPWGGDRFARLFGRALPPGPCAESWEIADRPEGMSILANGPLAGCTLHDMVRDLGPALLGGASRADHFPLLIKLIDARERTSLQVHPDEAGARRTGGEAKSELWYALEGTWDARIFAGLAPGIDRAAFEAALAARRLEPALREFPLRAGEAVAIPGGRMHAIDAGCLLYEVQQNSNTTFRVHDWERRDAGGRPRPLHLEQALAVTRWDDPGPQIDHPRPLRVEGANVLWEIHRSAHFHIRRLTLTNRIELATSKHAFQILFVEQGRAIVGGGGARVELPAGTSCLLPASLGAYTLTAPAPERAALLITEPGNARCGG
jgi:mannose-6-phosphate isomerase